MKTILLATSNENKVKEIKEKFKNKTEYNIIGLDSIEEISDFDPNETGTNLLENASLKAFCLHKELLLKNLFKKYNIDGILSDDSGLFVRKLNDKPGVRSARYAGDDKDFNKNIEKVLCELKNVYDRSARMETILYYLETDNGTIIKRTFFKGSALGGITFKPIGNNGFAYDSIFFCDGLYKTFGEATKEEKEKYSARSKSLDQLIDYLDSECN